MRTALPLLAVLAVANAAPRAQRRSCSGSNSTSTTIDYSAYQYEPITQVQLGPRPYYLIQHLDDGELKMKLQSCYNKEMRPSKWSVSHRGGGTLMIPEHSVESALAGARMGAGILECDVAFTSDRQLVCRHSQCDLHTTTNIVNTELNAKCTTPFQPAANGSAATAKCCTSDITLAEFKTLCAKMDGSDTTATTAENYLHGTLDWRTDLYGTCGQLLSLKEHIALTESLGLDFTPELKEPQVTMPFQGNYTQEMYAQQLIDEFREMGIDGSRVWTQSFQYDDILYWLANDPDFGQQAVYLDNYGVAADLVSFKEDGVMVVAPPLEYLVTLDGNGTIIPSDYATEANELGLSIMSWSLERSPPIESGIDGDAYYSTISSALKRDGDIYRLVDVLYRQIGIIGLFSDWSATVTYYANCFDIDLL